MHLTTSKDTEIVHFVAKLEGNLRLTEPNNLLDDDNWFLMNTDIVLTSKDDLCQANEITRLRTCSSFQQTKPLPVPQNVCMCFSVDRGLVASTSQYSLDLPAVGAAW